MASRILQVRVANLHQIDSHLRLVNYIAIKILFFSSYYWLGSRFITVSIVHIHYLHFCFPTNYSALYVFLSCRCQSFYKTCRVEHSSCCYDRRLRSFAFVTRVQMTGITHRASVSYKADAYHCYTRRRGIALTCICTNAYTTTCSIIQLHTL